MSTTAHLASSVFPFFLIETLYIVVCIKQKTKHINDHFTGFLSHYKCIQIKNILGRILSPSIMHMNK